LTAFCPVGHRPRKSKSIRSAEIRSLGQWVGREQLVFEFLVFEFTVRRPALTTRNLLCRNRVRNETRCRGIDSGQTHVEAAAPRPRTEREATTPGFASPLRELLPH